MAISLTNELPLIFPTLSGVSQFIGISIIYTNTLGPKNLTYLNQRSIRTVEILAAAALEGAVQNLKPTPKILPTAQGISLRKRLGFNSDTQPPEEPANATLSPNHITTPMNIHQPEKVSWNYPTPQLFGEQLGISNISAILPNLRFGQITSLRGSSEPLLIYINTQNRKMDIDRYISFMAIAKASNKTGVIFSPNGFTQGAKSYAEADQGVIFDLAASDSAPRPLTSAAQEFIRRLPSGGAP